MYSIGAACARLGISPHRLRKWEQRYKLRLAHRGPGGRRLYDAAILPELIKTAQAVRAGRAPAEAIRRLARIAVAKRPWSAADALRAASHFDFAQISRQFRRSVAELGPVLAADSVWSPLMERLSKSTRPADMAVREVLKEDLPRAAELLAPDFRGRPEILLHPWRASAAWKARMWAAILRRQGYKARALCPDNFRAIGQLCREWRSPSVLLLADSPLVPAARELRLRRLLQVFPHAILWASGLRQRQLAQQRGRCRHLDMHLQSLVTALEA